MKIDIETLRRITFGSLRTTEDENGFHFCKLTEKQLAAWDGEGRSYLSEAARALSGVVFDFETDSTRFSFASDIAISVDVYVDGVFFTHVAETDRIELAFREGRKRVTVYLPAHGAPAPVLRDLCVEDGSVLLPHRFDRRLLFIGDSLTQGWKSECNGVRYDSLSFANILSRRLNAESIVNGIGGGRFLPETIDEIPFDPDAVFVAYGTNDFSGYDGDFSVVEANASAFLARLDELYAGKKRFCISPVWRDAGEKQALFEEFCGKLQAVIRRSGFTLIDGTRLVPHDEHFYAPDKLHPNALGFCLYAENLLRLIGDDI